MTLQYDIFKFYWAVVNEKKKSNSVNKEEPSLSAQFLNKNSAFSPVTVVLKSQRRISLYYSQKGSIKAFIVLIYISANQLVSFLRNSFKQMLSQLLYFLNLALQLCFQQHCIIHTNQKSSTKKPFDCVDCFWGFY